MGDGSRSGSVHKPGETIEGRYRIVKALDEGSMGTVYLAEHVLIKRRVAVKVLREELAADPDVIERFMNEARAAGTLGHPNIVESTDMGFTRDGIPYIVFEYLEGTNLVDEIYRLKGLPARRAIRIAYQIASALVAAHNAGIVHRDLKSENIFLTDRDDVSDHVKVLDFGVSRFLEAESDSSKRGLIVGTPEFMAPEQVTTPELVDKRTDIYALGVIFYEMLTARRPFRDDDPHVVINRLLNEDPPPIEREVPPGLPEMIFEKMLAKIPAKRYQSMKDVQAALEAFHTVVRPSGSITPLSMPIPDAPALPAPAAPVQLPDPPKSPASVAWLVAAAVIALGGSALMLVDTSRPQSTSGDEAVLAQLRSDGEDLVKAIESEAHAARLRVDSLATTPRLQAAIETDAATITDLVVDEHVFAPGPGESLEIFQLAGGKPVSVVRLPRGAPAIALPDGAAPRVAHDGDRLTVVVGAPVANQDGAKVGALALRHPVDLGAAQKRVAGHALDAQLVGIGAPIALAISNKTGKHVEVAVPASRELALGELKLSATIAETSPPAPAATSGGLQLARFAAWGIAVLMAAWYVTNLLRRRGRG